MAFIRHHKSGLNRVTPEGGATLGALQSAVLRHGLVSLKRLTMIEAKNANRESRLADALRQNLHLPQSSIAVAEAEAYETITISPIDAPPDPRLITKCGPDRCLKHAILPWRRMGGHSVVATSRPEQFARHAQWLNETIGPHRMAVATEAEIHASLAQVSAPHLVHQAEHRVTEQESCRQWNTGATTRKALALFILFVALSVVSIQLSLGIICLSAIAALVLWTGLKAAGLAIHLFAPPARSTSNQATPMRLPIVSILVPLFKEREIADHLMTRLEQIDYPRELLDICLVLEQDDLTTRNAVSATELPEWIRAIPVPQGGVKTKPRALNYALDFTRGSIIGIYDAEDAPAPDQIKKIVARFAQSPADVACLQGILDYYNSATNWMARCFTLEYATWFRIVLPGLQRMGLAVPLGGTTLFFRRSILEDLGGWDAHNVTEDADLGIRLARHGYRTEMVETVTLEEANCRPWPWVKQRSRWIKGFAITYGVHMSNPLKLLRDLGWWQFFGVQVLLLGSILSTFLAPILWSFWIIFAGLDHPVSAGMPAGFMPALTGLFLFSEMITLITAMAAARAAGKPELMKWAPSLLVYFPLGTLACYKAMWELLTRPFYWDKTAHGIFVPQKIKR